MKSKYYEWTKELIQEGCNYAEIAKIQGRDIHNVRKTCIRTGLTQNLTRKTNIEKRAIEKMAQQIDEHGYVLIDCVGGVDGIIHIKCKACGAVLERKGQVARKPYSITCDNCRDNYKKEKEEKTRRQREADKKHRNLERKYKRIKAVSYQTTLMKCPVCSELFASNGTRVYCSSKCRNHNKWYMKEGYRHLFPLEEVYKRDNGICYICGEKCDWNDYETKDGVKIYGNMYPSRDHIIPKSNGGKNEWSNIRLAHRICNSLKNDSPLVKMMA